MKKIIIAAVFLCLCTVIGTLAVAQILDLPPRDAVYDKQHIQDNTPIPYPYVREADVMWSKRVWRMIDLREKMNQPFYYPEYPQTDWRNLITVFMDALKEGTLTAYDANTPSDEFLVPLYYNELMKRMERTETMRLKRPYPPYNDFDTIITRKFSAMDVKRFRVKEDWFFDKQRSVIEVRIMGICPVRDNFDERGEFRGYEPLFWIYFPEARNVLAKAEVFNRRNNAQRLTYDDVFMKRLFASYIYKEQNEYDRQISDYALGLDALLESERIKNEIFLWESDLWEY
ncbi:MAG: gliding motility protein GldN [Bacteroidales bacterium]|nr:gliding motility protein GldN [Bacteroidales bacterium]MDZ4203520.1 gliding motility protein GldN [Bacteroidales bacterium]